MKLQCKYFIQRKQWNNKLKLNSKEAHSAVRISNLKYEILYKITYEKSSLDISFTYKKKKKMLKQPKTLKFEFKETILAVQISITWIW